MRKLLEAFALTGLAAVVWLTYSALYGRGRLPDRVPTHFDGAGNPNGWGSPHALIIMPLIAASIYLLMTVAALFPSAFHYPVRSTPQALPRMQAITLDMLAWLKAEIVCLFAVLQWASIQSARTGYGHLFAAILPGVLIVILGTVGWHVFALFRTASAVGE
jgi:uncharacterized membrane protein